MFGLSGRQVGRRVAAAARAAGLGEGFSGHSGRTGLAAELSRVGASTHEIATAGGWKSAGMVIRYTRRETAKPGGRCQVPRGAAGTARLISEHAVTPVRRDSILLTALEAEENAMRGLSS